jgi:hypothetical protein
MSEISCVIKTTINRHDGYQPTSNSISLLPAAEPSPTDTFVVKQCLDDHNAIQQPWELQHDHRKGRDQGIAQRVFLTTFPKDTPFSRAVRMYCAVITSAIEARVIRAI